jgi:predicted DNA-binding protein
MKRRPEAGLRNLTVRLTPDQIKRLDALAGQAKLASRADLIRVAIDHLLPEMERDLAKFLVAG